MLGCIYDRGAFCSAPASAEQAKELYRNAEKRGSYTKLDSGAKCTLRALGIADDDVFAADHNVLEDYTISELQEIYAQHTGRTDQRLPRRVAFYFDFIEVCAGEKHLSASCVAVGLVVGPPIEINDSAWSDVTTSEVLEWLVWMVSERRVKFTSMSPVCTTFSRVNTLWPYRIKHFIRGFDPLEPRTRNGNMIADYALVLVHTAFHADVAAQNENPGSSMMRITRAGSIL